MTERLATAPSASSKRASGRSAAELSRQQEAHAARTEPESVATAKRQFGSLTLGQQLALAATLADCRRAEFTQRVKSVIAVTAGMRRRRNASGYEYLHREACLVFIVRRKFDARLSQRLPSLLLTPAIVKGELKVCAVPTDVQVQKRLLRGRAQSASAIFASAGAPAQAQGAIAVAVRSGGTFFVLSPMHVVSPLPPAAGTGAAGLGAKVWRIVTKTNPPDSAPLAVPTKFAGRLAPAPLRSFDAQFAAVPPAAQARLKLALQGAHLSPQRPFVRSVQELADLLSDGRKIEIMVPSNHIERLGKPSHPLLATLSTTPDDRHIEYKFDSGSQIVLHRVLELQILFGQRTISGDSGCAALIPIDGERYSFVGMHIGGNTAARTSFVIPAWELLDSDFWIMVGGDFPPAPLQLISFS